MWVFCYCPIGPSGFPRCSLPAFFLSRSVGGFHGSFLVFTDFPPLSSPLDKIEPTSEFWLFLWCFSALWFPFASFFWVTSISFWDLLVFHFLSGEFVIYGESIFVIPAVKIPVRLFQRRFILVLASDIIVFFHSHCAFPSSWYDKCCFVLFLIASRILCLLC